MKLSRLWQLAMIICCSGALFLTGCSGGGGSSDDKQDDQKQDDQQQQDDQKQDDQKQDDQKQDDGGGDDGGGDDGGGDDGGGDDGGGDDGGGDDGGGDDGGGDDGGGDDGVTLNVGTSALNNDNLDTDGGVWLTFNSTGDNPVIKSVTVTGDIEVGMKNADGDIETFDAGETVDVTKGVLICVPVQGDYSVNVTIADDDEEADPVTVNIPQNELTNPFTISGNVADGESGSEVGVSTDVLLYWTPISGVAEAVVLQTTTPESGDAAGDFSFDDLVGSPSSFQVEVKGGTTDDQ